MSVSLEKLEEANKNIIFGNVSPSIAIQTLRTESINIGVINTEANYRELETEYKAIAASAKDAGVRDAAIFAAQRVTGERQMEIETGVWEKYDSKLKPVIEPNKDSTPASSWLKAEFSGAKHQLGGLSNQAQEKSVLHHLAVEALFETASPKQPVPHHKHGELILALGDGKSE